MLYKIDKELWHMCKICQVDIRSLAKKYGGNGIYYSEVFKKHLEQDHRLSDLEYFTKFIEQPKCPCGCGKPCTINKSAGSDFGWKQPCGRYKGTLEWSKKAKIERCGSGNPMFGEKPWNKGLTKETSDTLAEMGKKQLGKTISKESKKKMSESAKKRKVHGHTGHKHSEETKEKSRQRTLQMIKDGMFKQTKTKPHIEFNKILQELNIEFEEEQIVACWSFDFYLPKYDFYIEIDGDYFHSNPKIYPNGPQTNTQKINWYRDLKKNKFCEKNNMTLFRFWECEVLSSRSTLKNWISILCNQKK